MSMLKALALAGLVSMLAVSTASAEVRVATGSGRVTIVAKDATVRQILAEWARVGQIKIDNLERIPGGPLTLELNNVPEAQALDVLLRSLSGYIAAPRMVAVANASNFDRIIVVPTIATPRSAGAGVPQPTFTPQAQMPTDDDTDDERPAPPVGAPTPNPRGPVFNPFPQPQVVNPQQPVGAYPMPPTPAGEPQMPASTAAPTAPFGGVSVPGMIVQPAPQPGQPGVVPPKRPGGGPEGI